MTLFFPSLLATWPMCVGLTIFAAAVSACVWYLRIPRLNVSLNALAVFWLCIILWFVSHSIMLTLVDSPYLNLISSANQEVITWLFMLSAFLGIPMTIPLLAASVWALHCAMKREPVRLGPLALLMFGAFMLGLGTSNAHDFLWCGIITEYFTKHYAAGSDLLFFIVMGGWFGIPEQVTADYATLGSCATVLITAELMMGAASLYRWARLLAPVSQSDSAIGNVRIC